MITVLHLITGLRRGGAEASLLRLVARMDRARFRNVVISVLPPTGYWDEFVKTGIELHSLGATHVASPAALGRLAGHVRRVRPNVLQTWLYHADLIGATVCRPLARAPLVWNVRNSDMMPEGRLSYCLIVRALAALSPSVAATVVNSNAGMEAHRAAGYRPRRWEMIPNGYDTEALRPDAGHRARWRQALCRSPEDLLVGMVARFSPMKAHDAMLDAFAGLLRRRPDARLVMAGVGIEAANGALAAMIAARGLGGSVDLLGERRDIPELLPALDLLALPSGFGEGFPNAVCEAMACGVPVVATDVGDVAMIVRDGGRVVPPGDRTALVSALAELAELPPSEREALGLRGRAEIAGRFGLAATVARYESLYAELAGASASRSDSRM